jgi:hypothetical protein
VLNQVLQQSIAINFSITRGGYLMNPEIRSITSAYRLRRFVTLILVIMICAQFATHLAQAQSEQPASVSVFATGLNNPRGLKFGPDGYLYVAEGGPAVNDLSTIGECEQVLPPVGPYTGGYNSRISKISPDGTQLTVVADNLPSSQTSPDLGNLVSGVADIAFIGDTLYGIEAGAGCSHGLAGTDNTVFRVNPDGTTTTIANLSAFQKANPVANPEEDDFEPDGTWYNMVSLGSTLYAIEPNHGELVRILVNGKIMRVIDISASLGHVVPSALTFHEGAFYVGNLGTFPVVPGTTEILKINNGGKIKSISSGLTTVVGIDFDAQGRMYALESVTFPGFPGPDAAGSGKVVRVNDDGSLTTIASGLVFPTAMTFGPDGALYVSDFGFGVPVLNIGQIVRIVIGD